MNPKVLFPKEYIYYVIFHFMYFIFWKKLTKSFFHCIIWLGLIYNYYYLNKIAWIIFLGVFLKRKKKKCNTIIIHETTIWLPKEEDWKFKYYNTYTLQFLDNNNIILLCCFSYIVLFYFSNLFFVNKKI